MTTHIRPNALWFVLIGSAIAGILVPQAVAQAPPESSCTIEMETYCLDTPPGGGWKTEIDRERDLVRFTQVQYPRGSSTAEAPEGVTEILITKQAIPASQTGLSEQEIAEDYRETEQRNMVQHGVSQGHYQLKDVEKGVVTIGGKTLYYMSYQAPAGSWVGLEGPSIAQRAVLYLYFPPGFTSSRPFYVFHIHEAYEPAGAATANLTRIDPVIASFRIREPR
jgi:hypothetical protein